MSAPTSSRLTLALIIASVVGGALWIEQGHRTFIDAPTDAERASRPPACPNTDNVPYTARCLAFLQGATTTGMNWRATAE